MSNGDGRLSLEVTTGSPPVVALAGEVDPHTAPQLQRALGDLLDEGVGAVVLDCRNLGFIDSSGLRVLVDVHRQLERRSGTVTIAGPSPTLRRLLEVTGLDEHLLVEPASGSS